jgi:hypothetical protein
VHLRQQEQVIALNFGISLVKQLVALRIRTMRSVVPRRLSVEPRFYIPQLCEVLFEALLLDTFGDKVVS